MKISHITSRDERLAAPGPAGLIRGGRHAGSDPPKRRRRHHTGVGVAGPVREDQPVKACMGWRLPWYSSYGSDFNYDLHVSNDESIAPIEYNYKDKATLVREGLDYVATNGTDGQGISVFVQDDGRVFHTYSAHGVGVDVMLSTYRFLDLTPLGRQRCINQWPWHETYGAAHPHEHHH